MLCSRLAGEHGWDSFHASLLTGPLIRYRRLRVLWFDRTGISWQTSVCRALNRTKRLPDSKAARHSKQNVFLRILQWSSEYVRWVQGEFLSRKTLNAQWIGISGVLSEGKSHRFPRTRSHSSVMRQGNSAVSGDTFRDGSARTAR
jgi:hypothetical protein